MFGLSRWSNAFRTRRVSSNSNVADTMFAPGMVSRPKGSFAVGPGIGMFGCMNMDAHRDATKQYVSKFWSTWESMPSNRCRWRKGIDGYTLLKKKSTDSFTISGVSSPGDGARLGLIGGEAIPFIRFATLEDKEVCRWVSRSSDMTLARDPFGPFFWGIAL